jgi:hypothetical protein
MEALASYEKRKIFIEQLSVLEQTEYEQLYRILKNSGENYSENCNGIFFDVAALSDTIFIKMNDFLNMCLKLRKMETDRIEEMNKYKSEMKVEVST